MQGIQALGGLRGEQGGVSFDIRAAQGDGLVDMQIALAGVTLDRTYSNSLEGLSVDADHEMPYCSFEIWRAWGGEEDFRVWTPMHR